MVNADVIGLFIALLLGEFRMLLGFVIISFVGVLHLDWSARLPLIIGFILVVVGADRGILLQVSSTLLAVR